MDLATSLWFFRKFRAAYLAAFDPGILSRDSPHRVSMSWM